MNMFFLNVGVLAQSCQLMIVTAVRGEYWPQQLPHLPHIFVLT